jgi:hypothetical protein
MQQVIPDSIDIAKVARRALDLYNDPGRARPTPVVELTGRWLVYSSLHSAPGEDVHYINYLFNVTYMQEGRRHDAAWIDERGVYAADLLSEYFDF